MSYHGNIEIGQTLDFKFTTVDATGLPTALSSGVISAYPSNSTTQLTAGITLTASFDSVTGCNHVRVVASLANGYAAGTDYDLVITTGTVGGVSVVGYTVGSFSIENRFTDIGAVGGDKAALANLEADYNGTGYAKGPSSSIETVTGEVSGNVGGITGTTTNFDDLITHGDTEWSSIQAPASGTARVTDSPTSSQIQLETDESSANDYYNKSLITIEGGTGSGQTRRIIDYVGSTRMATVDEAWITAPDATSLYSIVPDRGITAADVSTEATAALNTYDAPTNAEMVARTLAAASYATAAALATTDAVADTIAAAVIVIDGNVDTIVADYSTFDPSTADVNVSSTSLDAIADAVMDEEIPELTVLPTWPITQRQLLGLQGMWELNEKGADGTELVLYASDGTTARFQWPHNDSGTVFTSEAGEAAS